MNEDKATHYHRLRRRAFLLAAGWQALVLAGFLVSGFAHGLQETARASTQSLPAPFQLPAQVLAFVLVLVLAQQAGALPLAFFGGFILERRYGLSRQTAASWLRDHVKAGAIGVVFVGAASVWIYLWLAIAPDRWWLPAWAGVAAAGVVGVWAAPVLLLPLFFRFVPLSDGGLRGRLLALAEKAGVPALGVFEWHTSGRTSRANAALTGLGRTRRIILSDTLISDYTPEEVEAILAHEMAHHVRHDIWKGLAVDALAGLGALLAADAALRALAGQAGLGRLSDPAGIPIVGLAALAAGWLASPVQNAVSRAHERRADRFALELTRNAGAFTGAMRRLGARNLAEESPAVLARLFFHTHPTPAERIAFARDWEAGRVAPQRADEAVRGGEA